MARIPSNHRRAERILIRCVKIGQFVIDSQGRIWRVATRSGKPIPKKRAEKLLPTGYLQIRAMFDGKRFCGAAHRLVWQYFNGSIPNGLCINHKNGKKDDNRPSNLELVTYAANTRHAYRIGLHSQRGERNAGHKLTNEVVVSMRRLFATGRFRQIQLAKRFGVAFQTVSKVVKGQRWTHVSGPLAKGDHRDIFCPRDRMTGRFVGNGQRK